MCRKRYAPQRTLRCKDYIVAWTQGLWDHINKFDAAAGCQRVGQARAKASPSRDQPNQISLKETKYTSAYFTPGQCALLDMPNPHGYTLGERMRRAKGARRALLIAEERQQKARWFYLSFVMAMHSWAPPLYEAMASSPQFNASCPPDTAVASSLSSTSAPLTQSVSQAATSITVASSKNPSTSGQSVTLTATVAWASTPDQRCERHSAH
jgi:hypothetical protein